MNETPPSSSDDLQESRTVPKPLPSIHRRILGVLIEKARTTPDSYPLSLNGLVTGCNQKSNRFPVMNLTAEQVDDALIEMRNAGLVAEVHGGGRVPKYRHFGYDYLGVKGVEAGVMTELLLRGEQTAGELRGRASRFESIADLNTLHEILRSLQEKGLVVALTPAGRGQMFTHGLYLEDEFEAIRKSVGSGEVSDRSNPTPSQATTSKTSHSNSANTVSDSAIEELRQEVVDLKLIVEDLADRLSKLEA